VWYINVYVCVWGGLHVYVNTQIVELTEDCDLEKTTELLSQI